MKEEKCFTYENDKVFIYELRHSLLLYSELSLVTTKRLLLRLLFRSVRLFFPSP